MMHTDSEQQVKELLAEIGHLDKRDFRPWSIIVLIVLVVGSGLAAILLPRLSDITLDGRYFPTLIYGLISLVLLYNIYVLWQSQTLRVARAELLRELLRADAAERMAFTDPLTSLFNRRHFQKVLEGEIKRADRSDKPLSLMILDLDEFGAVNKEYGHPEGDRLLCDFANFLLKTFRQTDTVVRYGGDEFLVLLPETDESQAEVTKTRFIERMFSWNVARPESPSLTLSIGIAEIGKGLDVNAAIALADQRLRESKRAKARNLG